MTKIRVHEYAKKVDKPSKEIINELSKHNINVQNHMATLEDNAVSKLDSIYKNASAGQRPAAQSRPSGQSQSRPSQGGQSRPSGQGQSRPSQGGQSRPSGQSQSRPAAAPSQGQSRSQGNGQRPTTPAKTGSNFTPKAAKPTAGPGQRSSGRPGGGNRNGFQNRNRKGKQQQPVNPLPPMPKKEKELPAKITFSESLTVAELAKKLGREPSEIIKKLFMLGVMATINQELDKDAIELICAEYEVEVEEEILVDKTDLEVYFEPEDESLNEERPPVVTICFRERTDYHWRYSDSSGWRFCFRRGRN